VDDFLVLDYADEVILATGFFLQSPSLTNDESISSVCSGAKQTMGVNDVDYNLLFSTSSFGHG